MNTKSGKAKGRRLQNWVRDRLYDTFKFTEEDIRVAIETFIKSAIMIEEEGLEYMPGEYMGNLLKAFANHPENQTAQECLIFLLRMFGDWEDEEEHEITDMRELFEDLPEA